jgi:hypothetical protein
MASARLTLAARAKGETYAREHTLVMTHPREYEPISHGRLAQMLTDAFVAGACHAIDEMKVKPWAR